MHRDRTERGQREDREKEKHVCEGNMKDTS